MRGVGRRERIHENHLVLRYPEVSAAGEPSRERGSSREATRHGRREPSSERSHEHSRHGSSSSGGGGGGGSPRRRHEGAGVELRESSWRSFALLDRLDEAQLRSCTARMHVKHYHAGDKIIAKDTIGTTVRLCSTTATNKASVLWCRLSTLWMNAMYGRGSTADRGFPPAIIALRNSSSSSSSSSPAAAATASSPPPPPPPSLLRTCPRARRGAVCLVSGGDGGGGGAAAPHRCRLWADVLHRLRVCLRRDRVFKL